MLSGGGWVVAAVVGRGPASARHDVWLFVILGALLVPGVALLLPPLYDLDIPPAWVSLAHHGKSWLPLVVGLWAVGALGWAARLVPGLLALRRIARGAERWSTRDADRALAEAVRLAGVSRPVILLRSRDVQVPATWGARRPVVALPHAAMDWTPERLRLVLLHELLHVRRRDALVESVLWLVEGLYWFHPAMWLAARRLRLERERACDEAVLATGARASDYCEHLVEIMRAATRHPRGVVVSAGMASPFTLEYRVRALLAGPRTAHSPAQQHRSRAAILLAAVVGIFALGVLGLCDGTVPAAAHPHAMEVRR